MSLVVDNRAGDDHRAEQRRGIVRTAVVLALVAVSIYVWAIVTHM